MREILTETDTIPGAEGEEDTVREKRWVRSVLTGTQDGSKSRSEVPLAKFGWTVKVGDRFTWTVHARHRTKVGNLWVMPTYSVITFVRRGGKNEDAALCVPVPAGASQ